MCGDVRAHVAVDRDAARLGGHAGGSRGRCPRRWRRGRWRRARRRPRPLAARRRRSRSVSARSPSRSSIAVARAPSSTAMPRRRNAFCSAATASESSLPIRFGSISMTETADAELRVDRRELHADHAAAEHEQPPRHGVQLERSGGVDAARVVDPGDRRSGGARAGRDHGALELDVLASLDRERVGPVEAPAPLDDLDAVALEQPGEALDDAVHDPAAVALHLLEVEIDVAEAHAELREVALRVVVGVRRLHHRLGRDAADVEARAAHRLGLFDDHDRGPQLRGADRRGIAARP